MASTSDEENVLQENLGRRTRSGRQFVSTLGTPKTTRQSSKKTHVQASEESNMNISPEQQHREKEGSENSNVQRVLIEDGQGVLIDDDIQCIPPDVVEEQVVEEIINFEGDGCVVYKDAEQERPEELELYEAVREEHVGATSELQLDEKSSSFPFGAIGAHSETSDDVADHNTNLDNTSRVENSLLASLAGDNANSLPSVGGGESETDGGKRNFDQNKTNEVCEKMESDDSLSDRAIAEDLNTAIDASDATIVNAEMISEDELPLPRKLEINDAEEVSDEELPAPQRAELPPDAEVISEDELPASTNTGEKRSPSPIQKDDIIMHKKRKVGFNKNAEEDNLHKKGNEQYNPMSPTSESNESPPFEKKTKCEENDYKYKDNEVQHKEKESNKEKDKKKLPDLEKYWRAVKDDPADFTGWTYLLQYVDNESDADAAREAYDAFLTHYPYCYGYWRKYADYEKRKGIKANCNAVFKRGLEAIPLSVDLWIHYISHVKSHYADDVDYIRSQFERAIEACGLEFRSDKLWDAYIKWETEGKNYQRVIKIYDRLLGIPTQGYSGHFDNFQDIINQHSITATISAEEIKRIRVELQESQIGGKTISVIHPKSARTNSKDAEFESKEKEMRNDEKNTTVADTTENKSAASAICETFDDNVKCLVENEDLCDISTLTPDAISSIKDKFISIRRKVHKTTVAAVTARWSFEEGIKRPYFHVKPLERCQLKNWNDYLDFEIEKGNRQRILVLFERCLIACALYDEFWLKMIRYLESQHNEVNNIDITRNVFRRACEIHHTDKPSLHLMWSAFEECQNNFEKASEILVNLEKKVPALLQIAYRRINIERRKGDYGKCQQLYKHYIAEAKNKNIAGSLAIKFARFLNKLCNNLEGALDVLRQALERDPANTRVALQMIDLALQRPQVKEEEIVSIMDKFMARENIDLEQKVLFAQRKVEFLEDFGRSAKGLQDAQRALQLAVNNVNEAKKRRECSPNRKSTKDSQPLNVSHTNSFNNGVSSNVTNYNYNANNSTTYYSQQNNTTYPPSQAYDNYYSHWQYGAGYSGYGQWSGYGNYY